jgi:hypothetical protein
VGIGPIDFRIGRRVDPLPDREDGMPIGAQRADPSRHAIHIHEKCELAAGGVMTVAPGEDCRPRM